VNVLDLFSGIGGFSLGLERAGMRTVAFCEIDPYCRKVLAKHWPDVPIFGDIRELAVDEGWLVSNTDQRHQPAKEQLPAGRQRIRSNSIDVICGGFPCQDISVAGKGAGIEGKRSGLWSEYARIIGEVRPRYVIVENVSALLNRGLERVLRDLATLGFDAEWHCIPASAIGAPHRRDRLWLVAYPGGEQHQGAGDANRREAAARFPEAPMADVPHASYYAAIGEGVGRRESAWIWRTEPGMGRVAHGVPDRTHRLRGLGNAVVPQIPEIIGRAIMNNPHPASANNGRTIQRMKGTLTD
jgi:DNA (cytosine-5)-methyltransferase 1